MHALQPLALALLATLRDMAPILATIALFQGLVLGTGRMIRWACWRGWSRS